MSGSILSVALIVCPNGMGHARRMTVLANSLVSLGCDVSLFLPYYAKDKLKVFSPDKRIKKQFIRIESVEDVIADPAGFMRKIGSLDDFDQVISDNCVEILRFRQDAWLSGSFLWHETGVPWLEHSYIMESRTLLRDLQPRMISSALFTSSYLGQLTGLREVGLYHQTTYVTELVEKNSLLLSCGLGGPLLEEVGSLIKRLVSSWAPPSPIKTMWVEPELMPPNAPSWLLPANFSSEMFRSVLATVSRPGVGTITDSIRYGSKFFAFHEAGNSEMSHNAAMLKLEGLGSDCRDIETAFNQAIVYACDRKNVLDFQLLAKNVNFNGAAQAAKIIVEDFL